MQALLDEASTESLPAIRSWLTHAESTKRIIRENYGHITDPKARLTATVEENVLVQLENLRTHPAVAAALGRNELKLSGWVYKFDTGEVYEYDAGAGQYSRLTEAVAVEQ